MFGVIKRNPVLSPMQLACALLSAGRGGNRPAHADCSYTAYARFALRNLFKLLNLERGSKIMLPAYICDVVLLPLEEFGLEPVYYGVDQRFQIDFTTLYPTQDCRAIITVNYFGLSQDFDAIENYVRKHRLVWINDNSHGYASFHGERRLDSFGDFSITSFRKVLSSVNGAAIRVNNPAYLSLIPQLDELHRTGHRESRLPRFLLATLFGWLHFRPWKHPDYTEPPACADTNIMPFETDILSLHVYSMTDEKWVQTQRYALYQSIDSFIEHGDYPFLQRLPCLLKPGNSPMVYPLAVRDHTNRNKILKFSRDAGIDIHTWPDLPTTAREDNIFGSYDLWKGFLFFPLHQNIDAADYSRRLSRLLEPLRTPNGTR